MSQKGVETRQGWNSIGLHDLGSVPWSRLPIRCRKAQVNWPSKVSMNWRWGMKEVERMLLDQSIEIVNRW